MKKFAVLVAVLMVLLIVNFVGSGYKIKLLKADRDKYKLNTETLLKEVSFYKTIDSLNAAQAGVLELTIKEYEKYRADDAELVKSLQTKNRDLQSATSVKAETVAQIHTVVRDSVVIDNGQLTMDNENNCQLSIINYQLFDTLRCISVKNMWFELEGCINRFGYFDGYMINNESLLIVVTAKHKRFLGFLWKTKKIKDRHVDAASRNPNTKILNVEYVEIKK
jgi:hypothetical protein